MRLTPEVLEVLKNFSNINQSLIVKAGNKIQTNGPNGLRAYATDIGVDFPVDFAIYDLKKMLTFVDLIGTDSELQFGDRDITIGDRGSSKGLVRFVYSSPRVIKTLDPTSSYTPNMNVDYEIKLPWEIIKKLLKASGALGSEYMSLSDLGVVKVFQPGAGNGESFELEIDLTNSDEDDDTGFLFVLSVQNVKCLLPDDYTVLFDKRGISHFRGTKGIDYYIGLEREYTIVDGKRI